MQAEAIISTRKNYDEDIEGGGRRSGLARI
jgi:hypothetical protein